MHHEELKNNSFGKAIPNALSLIGNTPLIELKKIHEGPGRLFAKIEFLQPGGSVKDRAALQIICDAYAEGRLRAGQPVVEMTSGNMGAGLAVVCAVFGNPFIAVMSEGNSAERTKILKGLGAEVILTKQIDGTIGQVTGNDIAVATEAAKQVALSREAFYVDQFNNPSSVLAHKNTTGPEIWSQTLGLVNGFVAAVGSGGTFVGTSQYLKSISSNVLCFAAEPKGAEVLSGKTVTKPRHLLQGVGYGSVPPHWNPNLVDGFIDVTDEEATQYRKELAHREGLFVGFSAAANVSAAVKLLKSGKLSENSTVVTVLCDTGMKY